MVLVQVIAIHLFPVLTRSHIHAIPYFLVGIICGSRRGSFPVRDHLRSNLGIICGPGSFAVLGSFADPYRLPWEAQSLFANQLCRVRIKFNMAGDSNSRKVRAACLFSISLDKNSAKKNLLYIHHF